FIFKQLHGIFPEHKEAVGAGCSGTYENECPLKAAETYSFRASGFEEGESELLVSALDPVLRASSNYFALPVKIDASPPLLHLGGQLEAAVVAGEKRKGE